MTTVYGIMWEEEGVSALPPQEENAVVSTKIKQKI